MQSFRFPSSTERRSGGSVRGASFAVARRRFTMIVGSSGSGKTTPLNLVGRIDRSTTGTLEVCGEDVGALSDDAVTDFRARNVAFVFQGFNLSRC
jgi:putative ABC transport system ATP-binding protein